MKGGLYHQLHEAQSGDVAKIEPGPPAAQRGGAADAGGRRRARRHIVTPVDGGVETQVAESLTQAVRRRIRLALEAADQANRATSANGNGAEPPADGDGDAAPPAAPAGEHDPPR